MGNAIWDDILPAEFPDFFARMDGMDTVQIAANNQADFAYFPIMAGEDLEYLARFLAACGRAATPNFGRNHGVGHQGQLARGAPTAR